MFSTALGGGRVGLDPFGEPSYGSVYFVCLRETESKMTTETFGFWRKVLFKHKQIPMKKELDDFWEKNVRGFPGGRKNLMLGEALGGKIIL